MFTQVLSFAISIFGLLFTPLSIWVNRRWVSRHRYWLTDRRLVVQTGIIGQRVRSVPLDRIVDVATTQDWADRLFGLTHLHVRDMTGEVAGGGVSTGLRLFAVEQPEQWKQAILTRTGRIPQEDDGLGRVVALLEQLVDRAA